jgi:prepilin-type N-terminal cleavage/methylation domain-containing protein
MKTNHRFYACCAAGFTLVEVLVVILIIVVLAALSIMGITMARKSAAAAKDAGTLRQISTVITMYASDHNDLMPGPLFTRQSPVYNESPSSNPREWRRLSDCLAVYLGYDNPKKGEFIQPMAASWQKDGRSAKFPAWYMQQKLVIGTSNEVQNPWGMPAPASYNERMPMKLSVVLAQPKSARTWAITEMDQLHPEVNDAALKTGCPEGLAHGTYRLGVYFDGSAGRFDRNNNPL